MTTTLRQAAGWNRPLVIHTGLMLVLAVVSLAGLAVDPRIITGASAWLKPFKFAISLALYTGTLAWLLSLLPGPIRLAERAAAVVAGSLVVEMALIVVQLLRGTTSHFNATSVLNSTIYYAMAVSIVVLFVAHIVIGFVVLRERIPDRVREQAVRWGLGLTVLGMLVSVPMVLPLQFPGIDGIRGAHSVGVLDGGPGLPLVGWSTVGGDLRIGHFIGLHALQVLPLVAVLVSRYAGRLATRTRIRLLAVAGTGYGVLTVLLTWQALRAQSLVRPDALTIAAAGVLVAGTLVAALLVVRRDEAEQRAVTA